MNQRARGRAIVRLALRASLLLVLHFTLLGCLYPATEVVVDLGTNAPLDRRPLSLFVTVRSPDGGVAVIHRWRWRAGTSGPDAACHAGPTENLHCADAAVRFDGGPRGIDASIDATDDPIELPSDAESDAENEAGSGTTALGAGTSWSLGSFGITPGSSQPRDGVVFATFHVEIETMAPGDVPLVFEQTYRIPFASQQTGRVPVYLNVSCARRVSGCVAPDSTGVCTLGRLCSERGQTCGESGECVTVVPMPRADATSPDGEICGDSICAGSETCGSCPGDCPCPPRCGDGVCNGGETCSSCARDCPCGSCTTGEAAACTPGAGAPGCCSDGRRCATSGSGTGTQCCHVAGGACTGRGGCCGSLVCLEGMCQAPPSCGLGEAAACTPGDSAPDCCTSRRRCASNGTGSGTFCCADEGGSCRAGSGCCGSFVCVGGTCQSPPSCGLGEAAVCTAGASAPGCCASGRLCSSYTSGGVTHCCRDRGGACTSSSGCCGTLLCIGGSCQSPPVCGLAEAAACTVGAAAPGCCSSNRRCASYSPGGNTYCCRDAGGACTSSTGCCGNLLCTNGTCQAPCALGEAAACTVGASGPSCCNSGRRCASYSPGGSTHCCRDAGGSCTSSTGCCGTLLCLNGICATPPTCSLGEAAACTVGASAPGCCSAARRCASYSSGGNTYCCRDAGGACTSSTGCCGTLLCVGGTCQAPCTLGEAAACTPGAIGPGCCASGRICASYSTGGNTYCVRNAGGACTSSTGCSGTLLCIGGTCQVPPTCGLGEGTACTVGASAPACCTGGRSCASFTSGGATYCCRNAGGACTMSTGCCSNLLCTGGTCQAPAVCSLGEGTACTVGASAPGCCTGGRSCASFTSGGATYCCRNAGGACTMSTGCCSNLLCMSGTCRAPAVCGLGEAASCTVGASAPSCCSGGRSCASYSAGGATHCCRYAGGACTSSLGCCGALLCSSGTCR